MISSNATAAVRLIEKLRSNGTKFVLHNEQIFTQSGGIISAAIPASEASLLTACDGRYLLGKLGGYMVRWTSGFSPDNQPAEWYSVICRRFASLEELDKKKRYNIKRSLKHCDVRFITATELASTGYRVHVQAARRYRGTKVPILTEALFRSNVARENAFPDLTHNWGVYHGDKIIGYAQNRVFGQTEVCYSSAKLDPDYFDYAPGYALIHRMNEYYLGNAGFEYVNDGFRSIYHETNMQAFLISNFGFEKAYTRLHLYYRAPLRVAMHLAFPLRSLLGKLDRRLDALFEQERCRRYS